MTLRHNAGKKIFIFAGPCSKLARLLSPVFRASYLLIKFNIFFSSIKLPLTRTFLQPTIASKKHLFSRRRCTNTDEFAMSCWRRFWWCTHFVYWSIFCFYDSELWWAWLVYALIHSPLLPGNDISSLLSSRFPKACSDTSALRKIPYMGPVKAD